MTAVPGPEGDKPSSAPFIADFSEGLETGLYLALLELIDEGLVITGDEVVIEANSAACRLLERDYRDLAGKPLAQLFPTERAFLDARARLLIQGEMRGSLQVALPGGRHRSLRFIAAARIRPGIHALILSPDVIGEAYADGHTAPSTERDNLWPRLAAALEQAVFVVDSHDIVTAANTAALRQLGTSREAIIGHALSSVFQLNWPAPHEPQFVKLVRLSSNTRLEARVLPGPRPGSRVLILPPAARAETTPDLVLPAAQHAEPDATRPLAPTTARNPFEAVFADNPLPTFICDRASLQIIAVNEAAAVAYGYAAEALRGRGLNELRAVSDRHLPKVASGTWQCKHRDGSLFETEILAYPVRLADHPEALVIMHDLPGQPLLDGRKTLPAAVVEAASKAIDRDQLDLHFQPLVDARNGQIRSGEALLRWHHPALGLIPFGRFMNVARNGGLLARMGDWVLKVACAHAASWPAVQGKYPGLTVNIANEQVHAGHLPQRVADALRETGLAPARLELDLEERAIGEEHGQLGSALSLLSKQGVKLAIDDFGRGLSSIPKLKRYPFSALKLDPALIADVGRHEESEAVVEAIASMANILGLEVLARGVESKAQQAFLTALGCHLQQGPLFGPPMSPAEFQLLLDGNSLNSR